VHQQDGPNLAALERAYVARLPVGAADFGAVPEAGADVPAGSPGLPQIGWYHSVPNSSGRRDSRKRRLLCSNNASRSEDALKCLFFAGARHRGGVNSAVSGASCLITKSMSATGDGALPSRPSREDPMVTRTGGCLCRAVRYESRRSAVCAAMSCRDCQLQSGVPHSPRLAQALRRQGRLRE